MAYLRPLLFVTFVFVCACVLQQTEAQVNWRNIPAIKNYLNSHPAAKRMAEGPLDDLIDLLIALLIYIINLILGEPMAAQIAGLSQRMSALEG